MEYTTLGATGMEISRIGLGTMSFGDPRWRDWVLEEEESIPIIERAIDLGINFFDTANMYSRGESERILGSAIEGYREKLVIASKGYYPMNESDPNSGGLSRIALERALDNSRRRLGVDTIDLYQIHRWDEQTPIEETLRTLDDAVRRGDIRYPGASSMWAYQFAETLGTADRIGADRFVSMQNHYNLVYREEEREMLPLCERTGIGVIPWSPLARGFLTRPHAEIDATARGHAEKHLYEHPYREGGGDTINERVQELAAEYGVSMAQIALAWLLHQDPVDAPIIGVTSVDHLEEAVEAIDIDLSAGDQAYLEEPYEPVPVSGHE